MISPTLLLEDCVLNLCKQGLKKSAIIQKISLDEADAVSTSRNAVGSVKVHVVDSNPMVMNPNGKLDKKSNGRRQVNYTKKGIAN